MPQPEAAREMHEAFAQAMAVNQPEPAIFLAVPHYGTIEPTSLTGLMFATQKARLFLNTNACSLLAHNFNRLWCACLNARPVQGFTHFAMIHADVEAPQGWADVLMAEMDAHQADVISAVVPIKDERGLTSTGIQDPADNSIRRLTMTEVMALPETFDAESAGHPGKRLMINTGLWLARLGPWADEFPGFEIRDAVVKAAPPADGLDLGGPRFMPRVLPEDWNFSGWLARRGLKVMATRKVRVAHHGKAVFSNTHAWGTAAVDPGDKW